MLRCLVLALCLGLTVLTAATAQTVCRLGPEPGAGQLPDKAPAEWTDEHIYVRDGVLRVYTIHESQLAVKLKKPQKASELPDLVASKDFAEEYDGSPLLTYKGPLGASTSVAIYDVVAPCRHPAERIWLARTLMKELPEDVEVAGVPLLFARGFETVFATGEIVVDLEENLELPRSILQSFLRDEFGLDLREPDPFDDARTVLIDVQVTENPKEPDLAVGLDCLASYAKPRVRAESLLTSLREITCAPLRKRLAAALERQGTGRTEAAEMVQAAVASIRNVYPVTVAAVPPPIESGFEAWKTAQKKKQDTFGTTVTLNSVSNDAGDREDSKLSVDVNGTKGIYPGQFRLSVGAQVRFDQGEVEEDVTKILVNYDHYFERWLEGYAFVERFTNNFLGIEQRYEGGVGFLLEHERRSPTRDGFCATVGINQHTHETRPRDVAITKRARESLQVWRQHIRSELLREGKVSKTSAEEYCKYKRSIEKDHAKLQLSLAFSAFIDVEQPDALSLKLGKPDDDTVETTTMSVAPDSSQEFRLTVRPAVTVRPNDQVKLSAYWYFKHAIDEEQELASENDVREEWNITAALKLSDKDPTVELTASVTQYHDPLPPRVSGIAALAAFDVGEVSLDGDFPSSITLPDGRAITGLVARRTHTVLKAGVKISF